MSDEPKNSARPLTEPVALIACCNKPPPGCGYCFFCQQGLHGKIREIAARINAAADAIGWPRIQRGDPFAAGWRQWGGSR